MVIRRDRRNKRLEETLFFLLRLLLLSLPLYLILSFGTGLGWLQVAVADQSNFILTLMGFEVKQELSMLSVSGKDGGEPFVFVISPDSTAWKSMLFLWALMFAVPKVKMRYRAIGTAIGVAALWIFNLARVVSIVLAEATWGLETALFIHDVLWQIGLTAAVLIIWMIWMTRIKRL